MGGWGGAKKNFTILTFFIGWGVGVGAFLCTIFCHWLIRYILGTPGQLMSVYIQVQCLFVIVQGPEIKNSNT